MNKPLQYFQDDYLDACKSMTSDQVARFLEDFRLLHGTTKPKKKLISLRLSTHLLDSLKHEAKLRRLPYQTLIQNVLEDTMKKVASKRRSIARS